MRLNSLFVWAAVAFSALCATISAQDIIYAASGVTGDLVHIDATTGDRTTIASSVGPFAGIAVEPSGDIVATMGPYGAVFRVTPSTGSVEVVSWGGSVGSGAPLSQPRHISVDLDGSLLVSDVSTGLFRVNPATGDRTIVSSNSYVSPEVGTGPDITYWRNTEPEPTGDYVVSEFLANVVYRIDSVTGDRTLVTGGPAGSGAGLSDTRSGLVVRDDGQILITDYTTPPSVIEVHPVSGVRTVVTSGSVGSGETMVGQPLDIDYLSDGTILVAVSFDESSAPGTPSSAAIFAIDPTTGDRATFSSASVGTGPIPADGFQFIAVQRATVPAELTVLETN